jgi:hypothetical protein
MHDPVHRQHRQLVVRAFVRTVTLTAALLAAGAAPAQEQVQFTGRTTADPQLIHDAFQDIGLYIRENLECTKIEQVVAEVLPGSAVKRDPADPADTTYEQWTVSFCGKSQPFLVAFWSAKDGGTQYRIVLREGGG